MRKFTLLLILLLGTPLQSQSISGNWVMGMARYGYAGNVEAFTAPQMRLHWAATALGALAVSRLDGWATSDDVRPRIMPELQAEIGDRWGDPIAAVITLPAIVLVDRMLGDNSTGDTSQRLEFAIASMLSVGLVTVVTKELVRRQRPNGSSHRSFPSGHTSITFAVAEITRQLYGNAASVPFYLLATNTALSRIHDNKHYPSDVVAGAGLGIGIVRGFGIADAANPSLSVSMKINRKRIAVSFMLSLN